MKKIKALLTARAILFLAAAFTLPLFSTAQDIHFSQLSETPLLLNPANAGLSHDLLVTVNYKDQWRSVTTNSFKTFNVGADMAVLKSKTGSHMGIGLDVFSDKAGDAFMGTTTGQLHLSGVLAANDYNLFSAGIYGGFGQRSLSYEKLYWDNQYVGGSLDPTVPSLEPGTVSNRSYADIGFGVAWFYGKGHNTISSNDQMNFTAGFSLQHLNKPVYTFYGNTDQRLPMKFVAHGNAAIGIKNYSLVLEPGYLVTIQGGHHEISAGALVKYWLQEASVYTGRKKPAAFVLGGYYRFADAFNIVTGFEMSYFRLGISYDVNLSNLTAASKSRGGLEISLRFSASSSGNNKNKSFFN
ncbi:MAG: PorP/SprF family type IX secretion system membrane protein [Bacteroidota bacterium]|nr:PorP/SprF family type IX secretion system membrane protein [Bacteroidota bacterium]